MEKKHLYNENWTPRGEEDRKLSADLHHNETMVIHVSKVIKVPPIPPTAPQFFSKKKKNIFSKNIRKPLTQE